MSEVGSPAPDPIEVKYLEILNLPKNPASDSHKAAFQRAHDLRKFEIENYWKRSSYFWGFQLVAFGALALTAKDGTFNPQIVLIVAVLGALAALTAILSAQGSKFWQENWEAHVDFLEGAVEGNLHMTALLKDDVSYSVSRVNERFLEVLLVGWVLAFVAGALVIVFPDLRTLTPQKAAAVQIVIPAVAFAFGALRLMVGQKSELRGAGILEENYGPMGR